MVNAKKRRPTRFEPYFTTKGELAGTGLGLAVCRELAHQQGGSIELVEGAERRAVFELRLPMAQP